MFLRKNVNVSTFLPWNCHNVLPALNIVFNCSPSGKLVQIEYALAAVASGAASVGLKASNGVVLATEKKHKSLLYEEHSTFKIEKITDNIGMVYSGMGPDYRVLIKRARKAAHEYKLYYGSDIPTAQLVISQTRNLRETMTI